MVRIPKMDEVKIFQIRIFDFLFCDVFPDALSKIKKQNLISVSLNKTISESLQKQLGSGRKYLIFFPYNIQS